jgi:hypothetical protein
VPIPCNLISPLVKSYCEANEVNWGLGASYVLSEKTGAIYPFEPVSDSLVSSLAQGTYRNKNIHFNIADRLLCAMQLSHLWWIEPLREHYYAEKLKERSSRIYNAGPRECSHPDCSNIYDGSRSKKYCSPECRKAMRDGNRYKTGDRSRCKNGHARTPENTIMEKNGEKTRRRCKVCRRDTERKKYYKKRVAA